ncbi:MAG TPA: glycosyltransferase family 39 protein [Candidatus Deferrimicrobiaceae bacterium]|jgi:4-amino-4-deoxy-L-arabinose transferase-like glycosyltransferase
MEGTTSAIGATGEPAVSGKALLLFFLSAAILYFAVLGTMPLMDPDEGRYAEIPREMLASGDFVTPHLNGVVYLEKPPLYYWGCAAGMAAFGQNAFGARFFGAAMALLGVVLAWWMGCVLAGPRTALYSAAVLATSLFHYIIGRLNATDMTVGVMLVLAIFPAYLYLSGKRSSRGFLYLSFAGAALAFLAKGLIGMVFPAGILVVWALVSGRPKAILKLLSPVGIAIFLAIALPWVLLVQKANPDFFRFFFIREQFQRFATEKIHHRYQPFWFFLPIVLAGLLPWLLFAGRVGRAVRAAGAGFMAREDRIFLLTWVLFVLVFFSISSSKLVTYMTPLFPPLAVLFGRGLSVWADREDGAAPVLAPLAFALLLGAGLFAAPRLAKMPMSPDEWAPVIAPSVLIVLAFGVVPLFIRRLGAHRVVLVSFALLALFLCSLNRPAGMLIGDGRSGKEFSEVLNAQLQPGDVLAQYQVYSQSVPFYTGRRNVLVDEVGELEFGMRHAADRAGWFLAPAAFDNLWRSEKRVFCIFKRDAMPLITEKYPVHRLLISSRRGILIVNR